MKLTTGYVISQVGVAAEPSKVKAIACFSKPTNINEIRSFFGLVYQLGDFCPEIATAATPLRSLLRYGKPYVWNADHDAAFEAVTKALTAPPILAHFDPTAETSLMTSRNNGLGYILTQYQHGQQRMIQCGFRFVTEIESHYSATELELGAVVWAMTNCRPYLLGSPKMFNLIVDHQALVTIIDKHTVDAIENPRLQRMKEKLTPFLFSTTWKKGKSDDIPDALSRAPVARPTPEDMDEETMGVYQIRATLVNQAVEMSTDNEPNSSFIHLADPLLEELRTAGAADPNYTVLLATIQEGFPSNIKKLPTAIRSYWKVRHDLWTDNGLPWKGSRIVIPPSRRIDTLRRIHSSHQGIERSKRQARQLVYWPGLTNDIVTTVSASHVRQQFKANHMNPYHQTLRHHACSRTPPWTCSHTLATTTSFTWTDSPAGPPSTPGTFETYARVTSLQLSVVTSQTSASQPESGPMVDHNFPLRNSQPSPNNGDLHTSHPPLTTHNRMDIPAEVKSMKKLLMK